LDQVEKDKQAKIEAQKKEQERLAKLEVAQKEKEQIKKAEGEQNNDVKPELILVKRVNELQILQESKIFSL